MKLDLLIHNIPHKVALEPLANGRYQIHLNGVAREVDAQLLPGGVMSLVVDGIQYEVDVSEGHDGLDVQVRGERYTVEVVDPRRGGGRAELGGGSGPALVKSPMPGRIIKVLVAEGDVVKKGAGVVVVEAMKMQNELKAPRDGKIVKILVAEGANVEANAKLLTIE